MFRHCRSIILATLTVAPPALARAQSPDPSGHWEGSVNVPDKPVSVVVDVAKDVRGGYLGTFTNPTGDVKGLPLGGVTVEGKSIRIVLKVPQQGGTFIGTISDDGKSITGTYNTDEGGYEIPFALSRTGDAQIEAAPRNAAVAKEFEGAWNGTLTVGGVDKHFVLTLTNQADGTSAASFVNLDGAGIELPVAISQHGATLTMNIKVTSATYSGTLSADRAEIVGTWSQSSMQWPLTFKRPGK
jgi:hypothetical protein